jgi:tyrosine decarboxylase/aspartate 1-decarboxylase
MVKLREKGMGRHEYFEMLLEYEKKSHLDDYAKNIYAEGPHITSSPSLPWADDVRHLVTFAKERFIHGLSWNADGALEMEREVVSITGDLLGNEGATGNITTGGSESNACALLAAMGRAGKRGSVVFSKHMHYSFYKYCGLFGLDPVPVDTLPDTYYKVDVEGMREAVRDDTIAIVGTAGTWPYGSVDPIDEIGELAEEKDIYMHVDACFGGFILPFLERCGYHKPGDLPEWDFRVSGVSSVSADLHKNGHVPPPASCIIFRDEETLGYAKKMSPPSGCLTGTRPAATFAASWAMFNLLGMEGYVAASKKSMEVRDTFVEGVNQIPGLKTVPDSKINLTLAYSLEYDLGPVAGELRSRGWILGVHPDPKGIVIGVYPHNDGQAEPFVADLRECMEKART